jgi:UDP-N-acetylglucosamine diphosphorylase / glucose-1-phosphate thymidylyltransferase / UDP-N-acetylgalactosamine diphosphorylase / glucosamine-1-phosphate N-acetyltransferase / galactosamine-1-phosphate N-acetyltransferase
MPTPAIFFDDAHGLLTPLDDLRPRVLIRTGGLTTLERHTRVLDLHVLAVFVSTARHDLRALAAECLAADGHALPVDALPTGDAAVDPAAPVLAINSRCPLPWPLLRRLALGTVLLEEETGHIVAAMLPAAQAATLSRTGDTSALAPGTFTTDTMPGPALMSRPWHVRHFRDAAISTDLSMLQIGHDNLSAVPGCTVIGSRPLTIAPGAKIYPGTIFDCESGGIHIAAGAVIRPGCTLIGPVIIGAGSTVLDRAIIKANTAIGPHCKVAGEVGGSIFQGCANKAHDGHLGDSYIGQWANLGAGTTNSNLLNTYGEVIMKVTPSSSNERTGQQFMGCIIGDHVKLAICTRIMTGSIVHTGAMWAAGQAVTGTTPAFAWVTDATPPGSKFFRPDKFLDITRTVMARRKVDMGPAYAATLASMTVS